MQCSDVNDTPLGPKKRLLTYSLSKHFPNPAITRPLAYQILNLSTRNLQKIGISVEVSK